MHPYPFGHVLQSLLALLLAAVCNASVAQPVRYDGAVLFDPSTPATLQTVEYEPLELTLLGYSPQLNRISIVPSSSGIIELNVSFNNAEMFSAFPTLPPLTPKLFRLPGIAAGTYIFNLRFPDGTLTDSRRLIVREKGTKTPVQTFAQNGSVVFTLATSASEAQRLIEISVASDSAFVVWSASGDAPITAKPVHRMTYISPLRNRSFFFTQDSQTITLLKSSPSWTDDGVVFYALTPEFGVCGFGTTPVYRAFRPGLIPLTHRYTPHASAYQEWVRSGEWVGDGIVFCTPSPH